MPKKLNKPKVKVKVKKFVLPVIATLFFFVIIIVGTFNNDIKNLMGNSIAGNFICPNGYEFKNNKCKKIIEPTKLGDVNGDKNIDNKDVLLIQEHINGEFLLTSQKFKAADITNDGRVNIEDVNRLKYYIEKDLKQLKGYVCPDEYILDNNKCYIEKEKIEVKNNGEYKTGDAIKYNNSYWYVISSYDDYVTVLKKDPLTSDQLGKYAINSNGEYNNIMHYSDSSCIKNNTCNNYHYSNIKMVLDSYIVSIANDLKQVDGYKIRLININELVNLGFIDNSNTLYYETSKSTPYWISSNGDDYWVMSSNNNSLNNTFMVVDYNNESYVYEVGTYNNLGKVRPVINLVKSAIK